MSSSGGVPDLGTRAGLHGRTLISSGLADFDKLLGGGLPLGCLVLILEDTCSLQNINLLKYYLGEGVACGQSVCWVNHSVEGEDLRKWLPKIVDQSARVEKEKNDDQGDDLRIAWQYKRYIQEKSNQIATDISAPTKKKRSAFQKSGKKSRAAAGVALNWSHTFDISKSMVAEELEKCQLKNEARGLSTADSAAAALNFIRRTQDEQGARKRHIGRIAVQSLGSDHATSSSTLLSALLAIRQVMSGTLCSAVISIQPAFFSTSTVTRACHIADGVVALEPIETDSDVYGYLGDASSSTCLLQLKRTPGAGCMVKIGERERQLYVVRRKPKRLSIDVVEVDPDAEADQIAAADQWQKSASKSLVQGNPSTLDF